MVAKIRERKQPIPTLNEPSASIVVVCHNQAEFLSEAIGSALSQTHPSVEVVLIDDGSTDNTEEAARQYPDITYVQQRNRGLASARNRGIKESKGDFIAFLDADDRLLADAIASGIAGFR